MRIYIAYRFSGQDSKKLRKKLEGIDKMLKDLGHETFIFFRDVQNWEKKDTNPALVLKRAFKELEKCDLLFIEASEKGVGQGIEAGYAKALGKKIITVYRKGSEVAFIKDIADNSIEYTDLNDLKRKIKMLLDLK